MAQPTLKVTLPDGTTDTRRTPRAYTHVVAASYDATILLEQAREQLASWLRAEGERADPENAAYFARHVQNARQRVANLEVGPCVVWAAVSWHRGVANAMKGAAQAERYTSRARLEIRIIPLA